MHTLTFGYSPCPNDTFAFHALAHGLIDAPFRIEPVLLDIEELNRRGHALDVLSMGMSDDLEAAILEGATLVRIGTAVFGPRT